MKRVMQHLEQRADFDPYVGRKLYSFLFDLNFSRMQGKMDYHHLIYGPVGGDLFNWTKKVEIAARQCGYGFEEYENGFGHSEFQAFFHDPRTFYLYADNLLLREKLQTSDKLLPVFPKFQTLGITPSGSGTMPSNTPCENPFVVIVLPAHGGEKDHAEKSYKRMQARMTIFAWVSWVINLQLRKMVLYSQGVCH